jgi:hypothetical protein
LTALRLGFVADPSVEELKLYGVPPRFGMTKLGLQLAELLIWRQTLII